MDWLEESNLGGVFALERGEREHDLMAEEGPSREELRARLRAKTHAAAKKRRGGGANDAGEASGGASKGAAGAPDIVSTLMSMGLDDPALLKEITSKKTSDPKAIMSALTAFMSTQMKSNDGGEDGEEGDAGACAGGAGGAASSASTSSPSPPASLRLRPATAAAEQGADDSEEEEAPPDIVS